MTDPLLDAIENLSRFHREHEKSYAQQPRATAVKVQRHSRAVCGLADRWAIARPAPMETLSGYEGAPDLNVGEATQLDGVLFMEGEGEPVELTRLKRDVRTIAADSIETGRWLSEAMASTWETATALFGYPGLSAVLGDRHRIIANDWQAASMSMLAGRALERSIDLLDQVDFTPGAIRESMANDRSTVLGFLYGAVELMNHGADLLSDSAGLVHDNERRWRLFREQLALAVAGATSDPGGTGLEAPLTEE